MKKNKIISMFLAVTLALTPLTTHAETSNTHFPITYTSEIILQQNYHIQMMM